MNSQIWLNLPIDENHFGYITKLIPKKCTGWHGEQHLAASKGLTDCVALLVKKGADVNKKGEVKNIGLFGEQLNYMGCFYPAR